MARKMEREFGIMVACDTFPISSIVDATKKFPEVSGYKLGVNSVLMRGLNKAVLTIRERTDKLIIYDHQKAGTDIPETAEKFMDILGMVGVDGVILFPTRGSETQKAWTNAGQEKGLEVIVGGYMTHKGAQDYLREGAPDEIYRLAVEQGVTQFVVPGNDPETIRHVRKVIYNTRVKDPVFCSPGVGAQRGTLNAVYRATSGNCHVIIGRAITDTGVIHTRKQGLTKKQAEKAAEENEMKMEQATRKIIYENRKLFQGYSQLD